MTINALINLGSVYMSQGRWADAEPYCIERLEIAQRLRGPDDPATLAFVGDLADVYSKQGKMDDARPLVHQLLDICKKDSSRPDASAEAKNNCAWQLLSSYPEDLRDPQRALALAVEANEMTDHKNPTYLDTLSLAYHLTGDTTKAIENQKKAINLLPADSERGEYEAALARFEAALPTEQEVVASDKPGPGSSDEDQDE